MTHSEIDPAVRRPRVNARAIPGLDCTPACCVQTAASPICEARRRPRLSLRASRPPVAAATALGGFAKGRRHGGKLEIVWNARASCLIHVLDDQRVQLD